MYLLNTGQLYNMRTIKARSFNHQVYEKAYKRLHLSSTQRNIFQRLLGFLIRNSKPFPFSAVTMAELTGFSLRTVFNILNDLERFRLIKRHGLGKNRRFSAGSILIRIFTTVQNRINKLQYNNSTTAQLTTQKSINRATGAYSKTSSSLKRKEVDANASSSTSTSTPINWEYREYCKKITNDRFLGLESGNVIILSELEWQKALP